MFARFYLQKLGDLVDGFFKIKIKMDFLKIKIKIKILS